MESFYLTRGRGDIYSTEYFSRLFSMLISFRKWFTLAELMIVIGVIGILAASLYPSLSSYLARGRDTVRVTDLKNIENALRLYEMDRWYMKRTLTYWWGDTGLWDNSSQPVSNPTFIKYLKDEWYMQKVPMDPINNANCDIAWGNPGCSGYSYFYYCYPIDATYLYPQLVLWARMENPAGSGTSLQYGRIGWADGKMYYVWKWNEWEVNKVLLCQ